MKKQPTHWWMAAVLLGTLGVMTACGCGDGRPKRVPVSGQVLMNGQPLAVNADATIIVQPDKGRAATGRIDPTNGSFVLTTYEPKDGCLLGTHRVAVLVNAHTGGTTISLIPEKYTDAAKSELTVTITGPTDSLKVELTGELKPVPKDANATAGDAPGVR
jgi:hypothetical protein